MATRQPTSKADEIIKGFEKCVLKTYPDASGVPTNGWGHTRGVRLGTSVTQAEADANYIADRQEAIDSIYRNLPAELILALPDDCYDALVSFIFNVGEQAFVNKDGKRTDFYRAITTDLFSVPAQMKRWTHDNGKELAGLVTRRAQEAELFSAGLAPRKSIGEAPEAGVKPSAPAPVAPAPSVATGAAVGVTALTGAGTVLMQTASSLKDAGNTSVAIMVLVALLSLAGVGVLVWSTYRTHKAGSP